MSMSTGKKLKYVSLIKLIDSVKNTPQGVEMNDWPRSWEIITKQQSQYGMGVETTRIETIETKCL